MSCDITTTPLNPEPLPVYRRDPETSSINSSAPSYTSEAPTYHSRRQSVPASVFHQPLIPPLRSGENNATRYGLPAVRYAQGFQNRANGGIGELNLNNYNIHWSSINTSHASRQYHAVAARRASAAVSSPASFFSSMAAAPAPVPVASPTHPRTSHHTANPPANPSTPTRQSPDLTQSTFTATSSPPNTTTSRPTPRTAGLTRSSTLPVESSTSIPSTSPPQALPHEDPVLVGETAASRNRSARLYRERCLRGDEHAMRQQESRSWDFMMAQMTDWEERHRSWKRFRGSLAGSHKFLGRGLGLRGLAAGMK